MRRSLENWERGINIGGVTIFNLSYADGITLFASSEVEMAELLMRPETISLEMGLAINKSKTKLMVIDRFASVQQTNLQQEYETVDQFQYLDSVITHGGSCETAIRIRIGIEKTKMTQLNKLWTVISQTKLKYISFAHLPSLLLSQRSEVKELELLECIKKLIENIMLLKVFAVEKGING
ncbi:unnamed protein product [Arctia plantaginis]|uniref:Reverse transcriptase domain-containing protein n=1 Tax=Arctia plantaginis TaxID=874455 RepID=A0A8S0ZL52_ARCPL|nr:unnamed protein product [Arctia plantaginis]